MACTLTIHGPGVMAVSCSLKRPHRHCGVVGCGELAAATCGYDLTGARAKRPTCQMALCQGHAGVQDGKTVCPPHQRFMISKKARQ
jgi:hypothetical protein